MKCSTCEHEVRRIDFTFFSYLYCDNCRLEVDEQQCKDAELRRENEKYTFQEYYGAKVPLADNVNDDPYELDFNLTKGLY